MSSHKHDWACWKRPAWQKADLNIWSELITGPSFRGVETPSVHVKTIRWPQERRSSDAGRLDSEKQLDYDVS